MLRAIPGIDSASLGLASLPDKPDSDGSSVTARPDPFGPPILCDDPHVDGEARSLQLHALGYADCDADFSNLDPVVVEVGGATNPGFCR